MGVTVVNNAGFSLNLPSSLQAAAECLARQEGVSLNQFIAHSLAEKVGARNAATFLEKRGQGGDPERAARWLEARPE